MTPKQLGTLLESSIHSDQLAMECMGRLVQSQVEVRQDANSRLSSSYLHCSSQMLQKKNPSLTSPWNLSFLEALELEEDSNPERSYGFRHPHYQGVWKLLQCIFFLQVNYGVTLLRYHEGGGRGDQLLRGSCEHSHPDHFIWLRNQFWRCCWVLVLNWFLHTQHWTPTSLGLCIYKRWTLLYIWTPKESKLPSVSLILHCQGVLCILQVPTWDLD